MITIWHNAKNLQILSFNRGKFYEIGLIPIAIVATNSLKSACNLDLNRLQFREVNKYDPHDPYLFTSATRNTTNGDLLFHSNGQCWMIQPHSCFIPLQQTLPHVGIPIFPEVGDPFETFPTLSLELADSVLTDTISLNKYDCGWYYLETRSWSQITYQLLRFYK